MGDAAKVNVWVGANRADGSFDFDERVLQKLPPDMLDEDGELKYFVNDDELIELTGGPVVESFSCYDEYCGLGVSVFKHDWDDGVREFNPTDIQARIEGAKRQLQEFFDRCGITEPIGVWCQTDCA